MNQPRKILAQAGIEPQIFLSEDGCPNHLANEVVAGCEEGRGGGGGGWSPYFIVCVLVA